MPNTQTHRPRFVRRLWAASHALRADDAARFTDYRLIKAKAETLA